MTDTKIIFSDYFKEINEWINVEQRVGRNIVERHDFKLTLQVVTYKYLSIKKELHCNMAKLILKSYYENHIKDQKFNTLFLVSGMLNSENRIVIVKAESLAMKCSKYDHILVGKKRVF